MSTIPPGRVGSLTHEEELKLQQAWVQLGLIVGIDPPPGFEIEGKGTVVEENDATDKYGQSDEFKKFVAEHDPEKIRKVVWSMLKMDHPDALILRFLRARKWDVSKAIVMLISTVRWRMEIGLEENVVKQGESVTLKETLTPDEEGFMTQYRSGKSFVRGHDKEGRPIYIVKVRLHNPNAQSTVAMENYTLHTIESIRMLLRDHHDMSTLIFDLTGFGLRNMDYAVVKFIIKIFEANYPECLGLVAVHNAPWLFQGIWRIIKGWLDPVVAKKINFTNKGADLEQYIDKSVLLKEYGGADVWEYKYVEPVAGENDRMKDTATRDTIQLERDEIVKRFQSETVQWVQFDPSSPEGKAAYEKRNNTAKELFTNYWKLDPYIRARTFYDRTSVVDEAGTVDFTKQV